MSYYHRHTLIGQAGKDIEIYHRHRGKYDTNNPPAESPYNSRPNSSWTFFVRLIIKVSGATSCSVNWGGAANTSTAHSLTVSGSNNSGFNYLDFYYTADADCLPENPGAAIGDRIPPEKKITVVFADPSIVYEISFNRAELTRFTSGKFQELNLTKFSCSAQLLTNMPIFNAGLLEVSAGYDVDGVTNLQTGNKIPFEAIRNALTLAGSTLQLLNIGSSNPTYYNGLAGYANDVPAQTIDLRGLTALKTIYMQANRANKIITDTSNAALELLYSWGPFDNTRPAIDLSEFHVPATLKQLRFGQANAGRSDQVSTPIALQTSRDIQVLDLRFAFINTTGYTANLATRQANMNATINNLYQARAAHTHAGVKTLDLGGNPAVSATSHTQLQDLITNYNWSITYTAP